MEYNVRFSHHKSLTEMFQSKRDDRNIEFHPFIDFNCTSWTGMCIFASNCQKVMEMVTWVKFFLVCLKDWSWVLEHQNQNQLKNAGARNLFDVCDGQTISFTDNILLYML